MVASLEANRHWQAIPKARNIEASIFATDPETGIECRCRPDIMCGFHPDGSDSLWTYDLKSTRDSSPKWFKKALADYRYYVQPPFYQDVLTNFRHVKEDRTLDKFMFIAVESVPPYNVSFYQIDSESFHFGRQEYREDLRRFAECRETGKWPGYIDEPQRIGLPDYILYSGE